MKRAPSILTVLMKEVNITPTYLADLAGEYGGTVLTTAGADAHESVDIEFNDLIDKDLGLSIKAPDLLKGMMEALGSFRRPKQV